MALRVLTWNLFHGRARPARDTDLLHEFASRLASWEWDVALLQEVPPWWPPALGAAARAQYRTALTSRNLGLPIRRALAMRSPELMRSGGGSANAILVRERDGVLAITAHVRRRLCLWPERRVVHAVRDGDGRWFANLHATNKNPPAALRDDMNAMRAALRWATDAPLVLGGDFNLRRLTLPGFRHAGGHGVDHVYATNGLVAEGRAEVLDRGDLSDHAPVRVTLKPERRGFASAI